MTSEQTQDTTVDTRTESEIEASIQAKIQEAIAKAVESGDITGDGKIVVGVDPTSGEIQVGEQREEKPDPVEFPAAYIDDHESLADTEGVRDHFESHWGF